MVARCHQDRLPVPGGTPQDGRDTTTSGRWTPRHRGRRLSGDQLTDNAAIEGSPAWSPDGTTIAFHRHTAPPPIPACGEVYVVPAAGGSATNITTRRRRL